jgi:hypothetical protein
VGIRSGEAPTGSSLSAELEKWVSGHHLLCSGCVFARSDATPVPRIPVITRLCQWLAACGA